MTRVACKSRPTSSWSDRIRHRRPLPRHRAACLKLTRGNQRSGHAASTGSIKNEGYGTSYRRLSNVTICTTEKAQRIATRLWSLIVLIPYAAQADLVGNIMTTKTARHGMASKQIDAKLAQSYGSLFRLYGSNFQLVVLKPNAVENAWDGRG